MRITGTPLIALALIFLIGGIGCGYYFLGQIEKKERKLKNEAFVENYFDPANPWKDKEKAAEKNQIVMMRVYGYGGYVISFVGFLLVIAYIRWLLFLRKIGYSGNPAN